MKKYVVVFYFPLLLVIMLLSNCRKSYYLASVEDRICNNFWSIENVSKNGIDFPADSLGHSEHGIDLAFGRRGEIGIYFARLIPNRFVSQHSYDSYVGTWEITNHKKDINITITDSLLYKYPDGWVASPVISQNFTWKILKLTNRQLKFQETRSDGVYEFDLKILRYK